MRVEKIDIKKEIISISDGQNYFDWIEKPEDIYGIFMHDSLGYLKETECLKSKTYNIVRVMDDNLDIRFVGVEQENLFKEILNIGDTELNTIKANAYDDGLITGYINGLNQTEIKTKADIKKLNWFRRLFKLF